MRATSPSRRAPIWNLLAVFAFVLGACGGGAGGGSGGGPAACTAGAACTAPGGNPCHAGTIACSAAGAVCQDAGPVANGTACGTGLSCFSGGCIAAAPLTVYWSFLRHVVGGSAVPYDASRSTPGLTPGACLQSQADTVSITDSATGLPLDTAQPSFECVLAGGVQGVTFPAIPVGSHDLTLTGFQGGAAAYEARVILDVAAGAANTYDVSLPGLQDDLDVLVDFRKADATASTATCTSANIQGFSFHLLDSSGSTVDQGLSLCNDLFPRGVFFHAGLGTAVDRDIYTIRIQAIENGTGAVLFDSATAANTTCGAVAIVHAGADVLPNAAPPQQHLYQLTGAPTCP